MSDAVHLRRLIGFLEAQLARPRAERAPGSDDRTLTAALADARAALRIVDAGGEADLEHVVRELRRAADEQVDAVLPPDGARDDA